MDVLLFTIIITKRIIHVNTKIVLLNINTCLYIFNIVDDNNCLFSFEFVVYIQRKIIYYISLYMMLLNDTQIHTLMYSHAIFFFFRIFICSNKHCKHFCFCFCLFLLFCCFVVRSYWGVKLRVWICELGICNWYIQ